MSAHAQIDVVADFLTRMLGVDESAIDDRARLLEDLSLDSVQRLELLMWLASQGVPTDSLPPEHPVTVGEVRSLLAEPAKLPEPRAEERRLRGEDRRADLPSAMGARHPVLGNGEFELRPVMPEHVPFLYALAICEEVGFRWRFRGAVPNIETFQAQLWQGVLVQFVVLDKASGEPVGTVVAYNADLSRGICYLAAAFIPDRQLTGRPVSAVDLFVRYVFQIWNIRKIYMEVPEFNYSQIASGAGRRFDVEGCLRDYNYYDGRFWDEYLLAICRHHVDQEYVDQEYGAGGVPHRAAGASWTWGSVSEADPGRGPVLGGRQRP